MRMLSDKDATQVNRFVILTDSLLMVYDEEASAANFYKKIVLMQTSSMVPSDDKL
jgi:hypothetical protein